MSMGVIVTSGAVKGTDYIRIKYFCPGIIHQPGQVGNGIIDPCIIIETGISFFVICHQTAVGIGKRRFFYRKSLRHVFIHAAVADGV